MSIDWEPLKEIIAANQRFVLSSHVRPDADAIGSEIGMAFILESLGKQVTIVNPSEVPANLEFLDPARRLRCMGSDITLEQVIDHDVLMILDTMGTELFQGNRPPPIGQPYAELLAELADGLSRLKTRPEAQFDVHEILPKDG